MVVRRVVAIATLVASLGLVGITEADAQQAVSPFDHPTQFCTRSSAPPGARNASSPGVTPSSITIADSSLDAVAFRRLGFDVADFHKIYGVFVDEVNRCGGINGRKLILKKALYNPVAPDLVGHQQALCLKVTEDFKALIQVAIGGPANSRCVSVNHKTISFAPAYATSADFADSKGRLVSVYGAGDRLAQVFIADGMAHNAFKNRKVGVLGVALTPSAVAEHRDQYVDEFKKRGVDVQLEMLPCSGRVCTQGIPQAIRRLKDGGVDTLVLSHYMPPATTGPVFREMMGQGFKVPVTGPSSGALHEDSTVVTVIQAGGADAAAFADRIGWTAVGPDLIGAWRDGRITDSAMARTCTGLHAKVTGEPEVRYTTANVTSGKWQSVASICLSIRAISRALWSLGANVTTERAAAALAKVKLDKRDTGPVPRDTYVYAGRDVIPSNVLTLKFNYPCPLPTRTNIGCFTPQDRPIRYRTVRL